MTVGYDQRKKFFVQRIFGTKERKASKRNELPLDYSAEFGQTPAYSATASPLLMKSFLDEETKPSRLRSVTFNGFPSPLSSILNTQSFRVFAATWNVGGKPPHDGLNLNGFLPADDQSDIYVLGFQEIVPLNAGNVLVAEDNEPAAKWLSLINQALNRPPVGDATSCPNTPLSHTKSFPCQSSRRVTPLSRYSRTTSNLLFFQKPSLKAVSKTFRSDQEQRLKACNCTAEVVRKKYPDLCFGRTQSYTSEDDSSEEEEEELSNLMAADIAAETPATTKQQRYSLIASKQMVGIFVTVWAKRELVQHVGHLKISCVGRGIMGRLGNKGCISVSMSLHQTSFCFICSHLASGEKEGDELRRNYDVIEILKNTQFPKVCKGPGRRNPERILEHDRVIWLGDLNYRIALGYSETKRLLQDNEWEALLEKDQLKIEQEAGRVFNGWNEGKIYFAPTYKYSENSDAYTGETDTPKKKRRTPAWCDRILWHGDGIVQSSYFRGESRFSDHRPVCAVFAVEVGMIDRRFMKRLSNPNMKIGVEELLPPTTGYFPLKTMY